MWYAIIGRDAPDSLERRKACRPAHLQRIQALADAGRVLLAGPFPAVDNEDPGEAGFTGSLMVVDFPDLEAATDWAKEDPYMQQGVFEQINVKPFMPVLP